jgi:hypothetical protein
MDANTLRSSLVLVLEAEEVTLFLLPPFPYSFCLSSHMLLIGVPRSSEFRSFFEVTPKILPHVPSAFLLLPVVSLIWCLVLGKIKNNDNMTTGQTPVEEQTWKVVQNRKKTKKGKES